MAGIRVWLPIRNVVARGVWLPSVLLSSVLLSVSSVRLPHVVLRALEVALRFNVISARQRFLPERDVLRVGGLAARLWLAII
jgi:hypothetical protein